MGAGYSIRAKADAAEIYIYEDVGAGWFGGVSAKDFAADLKALGSVSQIALRINSYGGEVFDGLAIYRQLAEHPAHITSHIDGIAASIASVIAMAGDTIEIAEAGFMMIHPAQGGCMGCADDMRQMADLLDTITASIADVYVARTGQTASDVLTMMEAETWLTAQDCVDKGFANSIVPNMRLAAHGEISEHHKFGKLPAALIGKTPKGLRNITPPVIPALIPPADPVAATLRDQAAERLVKMRARHVLAG
jgi:ATP-dependent Clp protease protease subunit